MPFKDVTITITRETAAVSQAGFGLPLILATSKVHPYTEYADLAAVAVDFTEGTEEYKIANALFAQSPRPEKIAIYGILYDTGAGDTPADLTDALNTLILTNNDWYFLLCPEQGDAEITTLSAWVDANKKLYFSSTSNKTILTTLNGERTVILYHTSPGEYPAEAWVGRCGPEDPGSITWKFKTLNGISPVAISTTDYDEVHTNNGNTYVNKMGINQTSEGKTTSGEYIDVIRSQDWIEVRMTEAIQRLFATTKKIPYDNGGIALIVAEVESVLEQATNQGIVALDADGNPLWSVSAPDRSEISVNDRANRILPDINWEVEIAGAVHSVKITGVIRV